MILDLVCPCCPFHFRAGAETAATQILDRMTEDGPWLALASGDTFEDMVHTALRVRGAIRCPECQSVLIVNEQMPGYRSRELLECA
jgi:hypothetical protein